MGSDIHIAVERRRGSRWERVQMPKDENGDYEPLEGRNYAVFAILADVRNGFGFAGVDTGEGFRRIGEPRGLPPDFDVLASDHAATDCPDPHPETCDHETYLGDHSYSWVTVAELEAYDWQEQRRHTAVVSVLAYALWLKAGRLGRPLRYSGGICGPKIVTLQEDQLEQFLRDQEWVPRAERLEPYVQIDWWESCAVSAGKFYSEGLPWLRTLGPPDDTRLTFGFDS